MSNVILFLPPSITESFEIVLARACDLQTNGETLSVAYCSGIFNGCVANPYGWKALCKHCTKITERALNDLLPDTHTIKYDLIARPSDPDPTILTEFGNGPRSTILTFYRQDILQLNWSYLNAFFCKILFYRFCNYEKNVYSFTTMLIKTLHPKRVEFFNGRITPTMSINRAAYIENVDRCAIEVSGTGRTMFLALNTNVHDLSFLKKRIRDFTPDYNELKRGEEFFQSKRAGYAQNDKSYTNHQISGMFSRSSKVCSRKIVSIFLSSTDEFKIFGDEWFTKCSERPADFIINLHKLLGKEYEIIVRMHPNQVGDKTGESTKIISALSKYQEIHVIKPSDRHSSYELVDISHSIITFGSTIGLEATFWGKLSILAGRCAWEDENVAYSVDSAAAAVDLIFSDAPPCPRKNTIKVASYLIAELDTSDNLSYDRSSLLFYAKNFNYLHCKRRSLFYLLNRMIDRVLLR